MSEIVLLAHKKEFLVKLIKDMEKELLCIENKIQKLLGSDKNG